LFQVHQFKKPGGETEVVCLEYYDISNATTLQPEAANECAICDALTRTICVEPEIFITAEGKKKPSLTRKFLTCLGDPMPKARRAEKKRVRLILHLCRNLLQYSFPSSVSLCNWQPVQGTCEVTEG